MNRKFWQWVHDRLENAWSWVYRTKLAERTFQCGSGEMGTLYWSKNYDPESFPEMSEVDHVDYYRVNPDGTYTLLDGPTDTAVIR